ncbi:hypothetical protein [Neobacillus cucumis]|uniref:hypothetical protein n=1 Tax=Neobacillus cucumis TaxID=1740721 RepID=UPI002E215F74|nr:hypothetical protein [Neobacillus cucumis]
MLKIRTLPGGPAPEEMERAIVERHAEVHRIKTCMEHLNQLTSHWGKTDEDEINTGH